MSSNLQDKNSKVKGVKKSKDLDNTLTDEEKKNLDYLLNLIKQLLGGCSKVGRPVVTKLSETTRRLLVDFEYESKINTPIIDNEKLDKILEIVTDLSQDIKLLKKDVETLNLRVGKLEEDVDELKKDVVEIKADVKLIKSCPTVKRELEELKQQENKKSKKSKKVSE